MAALVLAGGAVAYLIAIPIYGSSSGAMRRLLEVDPRAAVVLLMPMVLAGIPLLRQPSRLRRVTTGVTAVLMIAFAILSSMTIGLLFAPSAVALVAATVLPDPVPGGS